ncbi:hypothetical protein [uncultured Microbulbifer sp.]|uniref:hypothetical protein n=1 Tax=uncultured Microbulbifer sp. TaxID=348147 RepID=UPI0025D98B6F|nr:hypothetical protein [uncultured Microbulbifer sp.]
MENWVQYNGYTVVSDAYIEKIFEGTRFGPTTDNSVEGKRAQLAKTLRNQVDGYWSGHTAYGIAVNGGFLKDSKYGTSKELTALGVAFLEEFEGKFGKADGLRI